MQISDLQQKVFDADQGQFIPVLCKCVNNIALKAGQNSLVKVFRVILEFRILRLTFHRKPQKSASNF